jgi:hypothetical protein
MHQSLRSLGLVRASPARSLLPTYFSAGIKSTPNAVAGNAVAEPQRGHYLPMG